MSRIAIIGTGISGLTCAHLLGRKHQVTLFESNDYLGGHTATIDVQYQGSQYAIDTGFIVFNDRTYPNFLRLLDNIGVAKKPTEMSFSVANADNGLEYNGHNLSTLFAQRRNLWNPAFYGLIFDILRFNRLAKAAWNNSTTNNSTTNNGIPDNSETLANFLHRYGFNDYFRHNYILPMIAAIWSSSMAEAGDFPLAFFLRFFNNHGLLDINNRPQWYVIEGGSRQYIPALTKGIADIRLNCSVREITRNTGNISILSASGVEVFDHVILACHADQALTLLADASPSENKILGNLPYRENSVVLHTDTSLLPSHRRAWASWNYALGGNHATDSHQAAPSVTYNMNILQGLPPSAPTFCVSLNQKAAIDEKKILREFTYAHPVVSAQSLLAQSRRKQICGINNTHFCGAYWYNGFHEDGVKSALDVCQRFGISL